MSADLQVWVLYGMLVFCRVGGCIMMMPGLSSSRIPMQVRLFFAVALSLAILPLVEPVLRQQGLPQSIPALFVAISAELATGALIGLLARIFFLSFQTLLAATAQFIGYSANSGAILEDGQAMPEFATIISLVATLLIFISGLHWQLLRGIVDSYWQIQPGIWPGSNTLLRMTTDQLSATFIMSLRITSPFFIYAVLVNFAIGLTNKMVPQIPVYFISTPFVLAGGLFLLYMLIPEIIEAFMDAFGTWVNGL